MATLREMLGGPEKRNQVIDDSMRVLDAEVDDKSGLGGIAIKTAFKLVKGVSPNFIREVVDHLLNDFLDALDPLYQESVSKNVPPRKFLETNPGRVADALLGITDARAARAKNQVVKGMYEKLRGQAKKHVEAAVPRLGGLFERHAGA
jgi:hypothetical protein